MPRSSRAQLVVRAGLSLMLAGAVSAPITAFASPSGPGSAGSQGSADAAASEAPAAAADGGDATIIVQLDSDAVELDLLDSIFSNNAHTKHEAVKKRIAELAGGDASPADAFGRSAAEVQTVQDYYHAIDGFAVKAPADKLDQIRAIPGVKRAFVEQIYQIPSDQASDGTPDLKNQSSLNMTGADQVSQKGDGQTIAIIDSGLDTDHEAFQGDLDDSKVKETPDKANAAIDKLGRGMYVSEKIPFARDYADNDNNVKPSGLDGMDHGTHVTGIAAANSGDQIRGTAPDAQVLFMKVAMDANGGIPDSALLAAIDDAKALDADTVNMSLGVDAGFSDESTATYGDAISALRNGGATVNVAAGNSGTAANGNATGVNLPYATDPDSAIVSSPASFGDSLGIASEENAVSKKAFLGPDGQPVIYGLVNFATADGHSTGKTTQDITTLGDGTYSYVDAGEGSTADADKLKAAYPDGLGDKVVLVKRGGTDPTDGHKLTFNEKLQNIGVALGAKALVFYNNAPEDMPSVAFTDGTEVPMPVVAISGADGDKLAQAADKQLTVKAGTTVTPEGRSMSTFSSWGATPDLKIKPEVTAPGGNIYSSVPGNQYTLMSGTSMATPQMAGITAQLHEYVDTDAKFSGMDDKAKADLVTQLVMSTAVPVVSDGALASPRQQGAGLANVPAATKTPVYLTVDGADDPSRVKAELGDSADGSYSFTLTLHNLDGAAHTFSPEAHALSDTVAEGKFLLTMKDWTGAGIDVTYGGDYDASAKTVTVPANGTASLTVNIKAGDDFKSWAEANTPNGTFIEGFSELKAADVGDDKGVDLSSPFLGFYGSWGKVPAFDSVLGDGTQFHILGSRLVNAANSVVLGVNPLDSNATAGPVYTPDATKLVVSNSGKSGAPSKVQANTGLLRNVAKLSYTTTAADGTVVRQQDYDHANKSYYDAANQQVRWAETRLDAQAGIFDGYDDKGNALPEGTYTLKLTATTDGPSATEQQGPSYQIIYDTTAPTISNYKLTGDGDAKTVTFDVTDNTWLAGAEFRDPTTGTTFKTVLADDGTATKNGDGTTTWHFSVSAADLSAGWTAATLTGDVPNTVSLVGLDYGMNESATTDAVVTPVPITGITLSSDTLAVAPGQRTQLTATVAPEDTTEGELTWTSSDEKVATVDDQGNVTGVADGTATITAASKLNPSVTATATVTVAAVSDETGIVMAESSAAVEPGKTAQVKVLVSKGIEANLDKEPVVWTSSDTDAVKVEAAGTGTDSVNATITAGDKVGSATVTATVAGKSATMQVEVRPADFKDFEFDKDGTTLLRYRGTAHDVTIPNNTKAIADKAFFMTLASTIRVPASVETIGNDVFSKAANLTTVTFDDTDDQPSQLTSIGTNAFQQTLKLDKIDLPRKVTSIGAGMFDTSVVHHVSIPSGVTVIPDNAFNQAAQLTDLTIPDAVTTIGANAFNGTYTLEQLKLSGASGDASAGTVALPSHLESVGNSAFTTSALAGTVTLPASTRSLDDAAFAESKLDVTLNDGLVHVGKQVFSGSPTQRIDMPASLTEVGEMAFSQMGSLTHVTVGSGVPDGALVGAFQLDPKLADFTVADGTKNYSVHDTGVLFNGDATTLVAYPNARQSNGSYTIPTKASGSSEANVTSIAANAFFNLSSINAVTFSEGITSIGSSAFMGTALTKVALPSSLETIGGSAFASNAALTSADIGGAKEVGGSAFANDGALADLNLRPDLKRLEKIDSLAFAHTALIAFEMPDSLTSLASDVLQNIPTLMSVHIGAGLGTGITGLTFSGDTALADLTVSDGNKVYSARDGVLYQNAQDGKHLSFSLISNPRETITVEDGTVAIDSQAFSGNATMKRIVIPEGLKTVAPSAFNQTTALEEVVFPNSLETSGGAAASFISNKSLTYVEYGTGLKSAANEFMLNGPTHLVLRGGQDASFSYGLMPTGVQTAYFGPGVTSVGIGSATPTTVVVSGDVKTFTAGMVPGMVPANMVVYVPTGTPGEAVVKAAGVKDVRPYTPLAVTAKADGALVDGASVTVSATATGGVDGDKEFRFTQVAADGTETVVSDWSGTASTSWTVAGGAKLRVEARDATWLSVATETASGEAAKVDKAALQKAVDDTFGVKPGDYTDETAKAFTDALATAQGVLDDQNATQAQVDSAADALTAAQKALVKKPVATTDLAAAVEAAEGVDPSKYDASSAAWKTFAAARDAAKGVLADTNATQEQVDAALAALQKAQGELSAALRPADAALVQQLRDAVASARNVKVDAYKDGPEKDRFTAALEAADKLEAQADKLTIEDEATLRSTISELTDAQKELDKVVKQADTAALSDVVKAAEALKLSDYTDDSAAAVSSALEAAKQLLDSNLTALDQDKVDGAAETLQQAIDGLVKRDDGGQQPGGDNKPGDNGGTQQPGGNNGQNSNGGQGGNNGTGNGGATKPGASGNKGGSSTAGKKLPQTSDPTAVTAVAGTGLIGSIAAALGIRLRRRK